MKRERSLQMMHVAELSKMKGILSVSKDTGAFPAQGGGIVAKAMRDVTDAAPTLKRVRKRKQDR